MIDNSKYAYAVMPEPITKETEGKVIGYCYKDVYNNPIMPIMVNDTLLIKSGNYYCMVIFEKGIEPLFVCTSEIARGLQRKDPSAEFALMHELGHCIMKGANNSRKSKKKEKHSIENLKEGKVDNKELLADAFAAKYVGYENSIKALEETRDNLFMRLRLSVSSEDNYPTLVYTEINNRIEALKTLYEKESK